jgi:hypothetical protein
MFWICDSFYILGLYQCLYQDQLEHEINYYYYYYRASGQIHVPSILPELEEPQVHIAYEAGLAVEPVWTLRTLS